MSKPKKERKPDHTDKFTWKQGDIEVTKKGKPKPAPKREE